MDIDPVARPPVDFKRDIFPRYIPSGFAVSQFPRVEKLPAVLPDSDPVVQFFKRVRGITG